MGSISIEEGGADMASRRGGGLARLNQHGEYEELRNPSARWSNFGSLQDKNQKLTKSVKLWIATISVLVMVIVIVCLTVFLPKSGDGSKVEIKRHKNKIRTQVPLVCQATRYQDVCLSSLTSDTRSQQASAPDLVLIAIDVASLGTKQSLALSNNLLQDAGSNNPNLTAAAQDCTEVLSYALRWMDICKKSNLSSQVKDIQQYLSAVMSYQYDCNQALSYVNTSTDVGQTMVQVQSVLPLISNALSMADAFDFYGPDPTNWKPPASKRGPSSAISSSSAKSHNNNSYHKHRHANDADLLSKPAAEISPSTVVSKDGSGQFSKIQDAVNRAPDYSFKRYIIYIKAGTYEETIVVPESKNMLMFIGDGVNNTVITGSNYFHEGVNTMDTFTIKIVGNGFLARDLTVENTAGPELHQAVALRLDGDEAAFHGCSFTGFQDTLYSHTLRHYFKDCTIIGTIDFIFGNAATYFENCNIFIRKGRPGAGLSTVTAHGRIDPAQTTGFVFKNCSIQGTQDYMDQYHAEPNKHRAYLGRPWKLYSRSVFLNSFMGELIHSDGWLPWSGSFALDTLFFAEFQSYGPGGSSSGRVPWSSQLSASDVEKFSIESFIQGKAWLPATNIPYGSPSS